MVKRFYITKAPFKVSLIFCSIINFYAIIEWWLGVIKLAKKLTRKQKKVIKKLFTPITCLFIVLFLIIGAAGAYIYQTKIVKRETGETNIMLTGDLIADVNIGETYQEEGYTFMIDGINYNSSVIVDDSMVNYSEKGIYIITYTLELNGEKIALSRAINVVGGNDNGQA